jgi:serine protease Do
MDDKRKDLDGIFEPENGGADSRGRDPRAEDKGNAGGSQERPSYYYSYGPFKSSNPEEETSVGRPAGSEDHVEMTTPRPLRPLETNKDSGYQRPIATWSPGPQKKRSSLKSGFAAFLAGAVVVGSLMFASDKMNLFSNHQAAMNAAAGGTSAPIANNGGAKTSALDVARPANISQMVQQTSPAVIKIQTKVKAQSRSEPAAAAEPKRGHTAAGGHGFRFYL